MAKKKTSTRSAKRPASSGGKSLDPAKETLDYFEARVARDEDHFWQIVRSGSIMVSIFAGAPVILLIRSDGESSLPLYVAALALAAAYGATLFFARALTVFRRRLHVMYEIRNLAEDEFLRGKPGASRLEDLRPPIGSGVMVAFVSASAFIRLAFGLAAFICLIALGFETLDNELIWRPGPEQVVLYLAVGGALTILEIHEHIRDPAPKAAAK